MFPWSTELGEYQLLSYILLQQVTPCLLSSWCLWWKSLWACFLCSSNSARYHSCLLHGSICWHSCQSIKAYILVPLPSLIVQSHHLSSLFRWSLALEGAVSHPTFAYKAIPSCSQGPGQLQSDSEGEVCWNRVWGRHHLHAGSHDREWWRCDFWILCQDLSRPYKVLAAWIKRCSIASAILSMVRQFLSTAIEYCSVSLESYKSAIWNNVFNCIYLPSSQGRVENNQQLKQKDYSGMGESTSASQQVKKWATMKPSA